MLLKCVDRTLQYMSDEELDSYLASMQNVRNRAESYTDAYTCRLPLTGLVAMGFKTYGCTDVKIKMVIFTSPTRRGIQKTQCCKKVPSVTIAVLHMLPVLRCLGLVDGRMQ